MKVLQFPLFRLTIGFLLGILFSYYFKLALEENLLLLGLSFFPLIGNYFYQRKNTQPHFSFGILTLLLSFSIGSFTLFSHTDSNKKLHYSHEESAFDSNNLIVAHIQEKIKSTKTNERYIANITEINGKKTTGKTILNIKKSDLNPKINCGNQLIIKGQLYKTKNAYNPNAFDYGKYLENKQIYSQLYTKDSSYLLTTAIKKDLFYYASAFRTTIITNLEKERFNKQTLAVAIALILGQKQEVSPEVMQDYQFAGAIHILSVSGLHIGFILLFLNFILKPIPNTPKGSFSKLFITIGLLSSFAFIAGLAPSVVRSVVMFSFVAIGFYLRRTTNIYHTILVSILLILLFQPYFLFDVGFQLSYLALFFIIWAQPLLTSIWNPKHKIAKTIWEILTVSMAAQIGTLPICLYYFHQFPGLFFLTNLIIIPFLSFIMILGILVMVLAALNYTPLFLTKPFEWSITGMNQVVNWIASFRGFVLQDIPFNSYFLISSYFCIITLIVWLKKPNFLKLNLVLIAIICFQLAYIKTEFEITNGKEWIVFHQKNNSLITERKGKEVRVYTNQLKDSNNNLNDYLTANFSTIKKSSNLQNLFYFNNRKIMMIDSTGVYLPNQSPDILLLTQSPRINLDRILQTIRPKIVIADGSNYKSVLNAWGKSCEKQKIPFHATAEKGFYKL
ncbi:ComEC/Rec2 family competence protein [Flavobacterium faecale]|uniref:ComEC/Rec2 family competence protein n=1 Tax=Flavobacterium faecale TaxID=1355330 RepID=UPI003AAF792C